MLILALVFLFFIVTVTHEFGHFIVAKMRGIRVFEFAIGIGPRLTSRPWHGTRYSINLFPIGGYVRLAGIGGDASPEEDAQCLPTELFHQHSLATRALAISMGALLNLTFAFLVLLFLALFFGAPSGLSNQVSQVNSNSPAARAGLRNNDKLLAINGQNIPSMESAVAQIHRSANIPLRLTIERSSAQITLVATPEFNQKYQYALLGFSPGVTYKRYPPMAAIQFACEQFISMIIMMYSAVFGLVTGIFKVSDLAGPVGIAQITSQTLSLGFYSFWIFVAFFNVNIGVINLLPLPALDGGRIFFLLLEYIFRRPVPAKIEERIHQVGLVLLLTLMAALTVNDILRILNPSSLNHIIK